MKKILSTLALLLVTASVFAQKIGVLNGPSGIPCAYLMENSKKYEFETFASAQAELPKLIKGEIDIGFLPPNAAAKVYNSSKGAVIALGIAGNGNLFVISKDDSVKSLADLAGKTVACAGQGATPEYMMNFLLAKNGVSGVTLDFSTPNPNIAAAVIEGKFDYAVVPEPFATVAEKKSADVKRVLNIQEEFAKIEGGDFPMTLLVVNAKYAKKHKKQIKNFLKDFEKASEWTVKNPLEAGKLVEAHNLGLKAPIASAAIPNASYTWKPAKSGKADIEKLLKIFMDFAPESVGGKLPAEEFYW